VTSQITVRSWETLTGEDVTDGGVSGTGRFKISGAITDAGKITDYRTVKGTTIVIRRVTVGKRGAIAFRIMIQMGNTAPAPWTITSGTKAYKRAARKGNPGSRQLFGHSSHVRAERNRFPITTASVGPPVAPADANS
jgi:hypothetical protein